MVFAENFQLEGVLFFLKIFDSTFIPIPSVDSRCLQLLFCTVPVMLMI